MPVTLKCKKCGKKFQTIPSLPRKFCSNDCYWSSMRGKPKPKVPWRKSRRCKACQKLFMPLREDSAFCSHACASHVRKTNRKCFLCGKPTKDSTFKYCSQKCVNEVRRSKVKKITRNCLECKLEFVIAKKKTAKFCSVACSKSNRKPDPVLCPNCGETVPLKDRKYCSPECRKEFRTLNANFEAFMEGMTDDEE